MLKLIVLAVLPLTLSACSTDRADGMFHVTRANAGEMEDRVAINIDVSPGKPATYRGVCMTDYRKSVTVDGKTVSQGKGQLTYGTVIKASATEMEGKSRVVTLNITQTCAPELHPQKYDNDLSIDTPSYTRGSARMTMLVSRGEIIRITGPDAPCAFPRFIIHPSD